MASHRALLFLLCTALALPAGAAQWAATFDHVGPLKIGMPLAAVNHVLGEHLSAPSVPTQDPSNRCFIVQPARFPALYLMIVDGRLERVAIVARGIQTAKRIQVGDAEETVLAAYGARAHITPAAYYVEDPHHKYITVLSTGGRYGLLFVSAYGKIKRYLAGTAETIQYPEGCS